MPEGAVGRTLYLAIDSSAAQRGAEEFKRAVDGVKQSATSAGAAVDDFSDEFIELAQRLDPAIRAEIQLQKAVAVLNHELAAGRISLSNYTDFMERARREAEKTTGAHSRFAGVMRSFVGGLGAGLGFGGAIGAAQLVSGFISAADAAQRLQNQLTVATGSASGAAQVFERLYQVAQRTGAPIEDLATMFARASIAGKELGATQSDLLRMTEAIGNALKISGQSPAAASGALLQLSQALGAGTVRAEEFNSMLEGALPLLQAAAKHIDGAGGSVARLRQMVIDGNLSSQQFFRGIIAASADLEAQASKMESTFAQAMVRMGNSLVRLVGTINDATGATAALQGAFGILSRFADEVSDSLTRTGYSLSKAIEQQSAALQSMRKLAAEREEFNQLSVGERIGKVLQTGQLPTPQSADSLRKSIADGEARLRELQQRQRDSQAALAEAAERERERSGVRPVDPAEASRANRAAAEKSLEIRKLGLDTLSKEVAATDEVNKKLRLQIELLTRKRDIEIEEIRSDKKKFPTPEAQDLAVAEINRSFDADRRKVELDARRQAEAEAKRAAAAGRRAGAADQREQRKAQREIEERERDLDALAKLEAEAANDRYDALEKIEADRQKRLRDLRKLDKLTPAERRDAELSVEAIAAQQSRKAYEEQLDLERQKADLISNARVTQLEAQAEIAEDYREKQRLMLEALEERHKIELRSIEEAGDRYALSEEERRQLVESSNASYLARQQEMLREQSDDTVDSAGLLAEGFREFGLAASSAFEDAIIKGEEFSEVLQGLADDLQRIVLRKTVSEPLSQGLDSLLGLGKDAGPSSGLAGLLRSAGSWVSGLFSNPLEEGSEVGGFRLAGTNAAPGFGSFDVGGGLLAGGLGSDDLSGGAAADMLQDGAQALSSSADGLSLAATGMLGSADALGSAGAAGALGTAATTVGRTLPSIFQQVMGQMVGTMTVNAASVTVNGGVGSAGAAGGGGLFSGIGGWLSGLFGSGVSAGNSASVIQGASSGGWTPGGWFASGAAIDRGAVVPFATGGIVSHPTLFPLANGTGLMGEAGPEAIMPLRRAGGSYAVQAMTEAGEVRRLPLQRMPSGELGVRATPFARGGVIDAGSIVPFMRGGVIEPRLPQATPPRDAGPDRRPAVNIVVNNNAGAQVQTEQRENERGGIDLIMTLDPIVADIISRRGTASNRALRRGGDDRGPQR